MSPEPYVRRTETLPETNANPATRETPTDGAPSRENGTQGAMRTVTGSSTHVDLPVGQPVGETQHPRTWIIELPWETPPVKPNGGHGNVYAHAAKVKRTRQTMGILARNAKLPAMARCRVELTWFVADRIKRDADNLAWTLKPLCDALSSDRKPWDWRIVEDDTPEFMEKLMPRVVYRAGGRKHLVLTITELA